MTRTLLSIILFLAFTVAPLRAAEFDHQAHVEEYVDTADCTLCHLSGAESIVPEFDVCYACHDAKLLAEAVLKPTMSHGPVWALNHGPEAKRDSASCSSCHQQNDCLDCHKAGFAHEQGRFSNNLINVHRGDFNVSHPLAARADAQRCYACHEQRFCSDCHDAWRFRNDDIGSPSHRRTFDKGLDGVDIDRIHAGINNSMACDICHADESIDFHSWSIGHAREARRSLASCQACHPEGEVCLRCHSARGGAFGFNPHPKDWDDFKDNLRKASNGKTCRRCH